MECNLRRSHRFGSGASCPPKIVGLLNEEFRPTLQGNEKRKKNHYSL